MILLGWEIGTGKRVEIPETGHLAWFGQTQLSGKTTALEAIAFRGELKAVAFITKQGEGGFLTGRMIPPYFSEPTNDEEQPLWRWVKSILEASQQRKMNFEESWIIRACEDPRQAKTLRDVHENIKSLLGGERMPTQPRKRTTVAGTRIHIGNAPAKWIRKPVSGMNAGIYTSLKAYFDIVMPQLARLPYTKKLELGPGLNVMNLQEYAMETQALVIRSVMEWVYQHEKNVRVIVPEAQDFVPQGKNSPVKMACETLVRKAGANKNFMWLDSQDMAAVDKFALRACSIVGVGVQTEGHEIDRSLASLFSPHLKAVDIARLKIGEFFVRTSEARVSKVYVQPAWMDSELHAQAIAKGEETVSSARQMLRAFKDSRKLDPAPVHGEPVQGKPQLQQVQIQEESEVMEGQVNSTREASANEQRNRTQSASDLDRRSDHGATNVDIRRETRRDFAESFRDSTPEIAESEQVMPKKTPSEIIRGYLGYTAIRDIPVLEGALHDLLNEHAKLIEAHDALAVRIRESEAAGETIFYGGPKSSPTGNGSITGDAQEEIYRYIISRATKDPKVLAILLNRPELSIHIDRQTIQADGGSLRGALALLISKKFFDTPQNGNTAFNELKRLGRSVAKPNVYRELDKLAELGFVTKEDAGYQAVPGMKINITETKEGKAAAAR